MIMSRLSLRLREVQMSLNSPRLHLHLMVLIVLPEQMTTRTTRPSRPTAPGHPLLPSTLPLHSAVDARP